MKPPNLLTKLHARLGDFWWYSLMLFCACRAGDVLNAFVGLWLVPKYVDPSELGAVMPLQQLSTLFSIPLSILATVFAKYVNTYATHGEYGKMKSFVCDILLTACLFFVICIIATHLIIPHFYVRLNVTSGMLTALILAAGFCNNISTLFTAALQGLKKFKTITVQNLISTPIRLLTLIIAMPFRALSGYMLGQTTPSASCSLLAAYSLYKDLKNIPSDTRWRKDIPNICRYFFSIAVYASLSALFSSIQMTVYRQRLPEIESAAYYMLSRFSEITSYLGMSMIVIIFPLASEAHEKRQQQISMLIKTILSTGAVTIIMTCIFAIFSKNIIMALDIWRTYIEFSYLLPWLTIVSGLGTIILSIIAYESACRRFLVVNLNLLINAVWTIVLVSFTGYHFFENIFPARIIDFMSMCNLSNLHNITISTVAVLSIQLIVSLSIILRRKK